MKILAGINTYNQYTRNEAYQELWHNNVYFTGFGSDKVYWSAFLDACKRIAQRLSRSAPSRPASNRTNVRTPVKLPTVPIERETDAVARLQSIGTLRSLRVTPAAPTGWAVLVRLKLPGKGRVYRYGIVHRREDAEDLIHRWIDKGYWTPDKG